LYRGSSDGFTAIRGKATDLDSGYHHVVAELQGFPE